MQIRRFILTTAIVLVNTMYATVMAEDYPATDEFVDVFDGRFEPHVHEKCAWQGPPSNFVFPEMSEITIPDGGFSRAVGDVYRIVCRIHIVRRSDGSGGFDEQLVPKMMEDLNYGFRDTPFVFAMDPLLVYVDNDTYYDDFPTFQSAFDMLFDHFEPGIMNWYITPSISGGTAVAGTWIGPASPVRGILMAYATAGSPANIVTPTHEMGHIFQMYHPYESVFGVECTSGSNCNFAGDLICDTPASPIIFSANTTATGIYFANAPGPCNNDPPFNPNTRLYMDAGWAAGHILRNQFSPGEVARGLSFLLNPNSSLSVNDLIGPDRPDVFVDCDNNGIDDIEDILAGNATDLGRDLVPDSCQTFPEPGDLLVCGMNSSQVNRPRYYDGDTGQWRGDLWNGMTWAHKMRLGPDGLVYLARLTIIQRLDLETGRTKDNFIDGVLEGAGTFVDLLFEPSGNILILDNISKNIRRYDGDTGLFMEEFIDLTFVANFGPKYMEFGPDGHIYVVGNGSGGNAVRKFNSQSGAYLGQFVQAGSGGLTAGQGLVFHADGFLYVSNGGANNILRYDAHSGAFDTEFVTAGSGGLSNPHSLRFGPDGHLYVASRSTHSIKRYDGTTGEYIDDFVEAGSGGSPGTGGLEQPAGLMFVPPGDLPLTPDADFRFNIEGDLKLCSSDIDCAIGVAGPVPQAVCREGTCYVARQRFLSIRPSNGNAGRSRAIRIRLDSGAAGSVQLGFLQPPVDRASNGPGPNLFHHSVIDTAPFYMDWNSLTEGHITVGDCEIAPGYDYIIQSIVEGDNLSNEFRYSPPLILPTADTHGDVTGGGAPGDPPNGVTTLVDVFAVIRGFQEEQAEPKDWLDLEPNTGTAQPNLAVSLADAFIAVQGFQQEAYPGPLPQDCP